MGAPIFQATHDRIRVVVVDADNIGTQLMASALKRCRNYFDVVALANNSAEAINKLKQHEPNVALVSPELQDGPKSGLKVLQKLRDSRLRTAPVVLLRTPNPQSIIESFRAGARGVFCRADSFKSLSKCIRAVHQGRIWVSNEDLEYLLEALTHLNPTQLLCPTGIPLVTRREEDIVRLVAEGMKNREIAEQLHLTDHTVSNYLYRIFEKLGVSSRVELVLYAMSRQDRESPSSHDLHTAVQPQCPTVPLELPKSLETNPRIVT